MLQLDLMLPLLLLLLATAATGLDIGSSATWSLDLTQAPAQNAAVESYTYIGLAQGGGYQQLVDVGGRQEEAHGAMQLLCMPAAD